MWRSPHEPAATSAWLIEYSIGGRDEQHPLAVHTGDCWSGSQADRARPLTRETALAALAEDVTDKLAVTLPARPAATRLPHRLPRDPRGRTGQEAPWIRSRNSGSRGRYRQCAYQITGRVSKFGGHSKILPRSPSF
ncbi:DUF6233 domain-containing protein [Streptomyces sp. NPDC048696]|uniref:DUF6233 domain-containing protein n=1 Tax=Streptomyces sp. NPDC048696 TaxID=3365585 RepID=UPI00371E2566